MTNRRVDEDELRSQAAEVLPDREAMSLVDPSGGAGGVFSGMEPGLGIVNIGTDGTGSTTEPETGGLFDTGDLAAAEGDRDETLTSEDSAESIT